MLIPTVARGKRQPHQGSTLVYPWPCLRAALAPALAPVNGDSDPGLDVSELTRVRHDGGPGAGTNARSGKLRHDWLVTE